MVTPDCLASLLFLPWQPYYNTPFQDACIMNGRDVVINVIEEILTRYHSEGTPLHIIEALMMAAANENIHLDCSYFLLRSEPDVLVRILLSGPHNNNNNDDDDDGGGGNDGGGNHNYGNEVDDDEDHHEDDDGDGIGSDGDDDTGNSKTTEKVQGNEREEEEYDLIN